MDNSGHDFGFALARAKDGKRIARRGWNGEGQFVYYVPGGLYEAQTEVAKQYTARVDGLVDYTPYLAIKTVQGTVAPWLASQTDMLAEDWFVVVS